jgi:predicted HicB family RNase H-like nuclease
MATKTRAKKTTAAHTIEARAAQILEIARKAFTRSSNWIEFSNALFGIGAPFGRLFPTPAEREAFMQTEEHRQIEEMLEKLQGGEDEPPPAPAPGKQARFVLRLPRSMFEALKAEAEAEGISINQLCVAKLATTLRSNLFLKC